MTSEKQQQEPRTPTTRPWIGRSVLWTVLLVYLMWCTGSVPWAPPTTMLNLSIALLFLWFVYYWICIAVALRFAWWGSPQCSCEPFELDQLGATALSPRIRETMSELEPEGFLPRVHFRVFGLTPVFIEFNSLFENPQTQGIAILATYVAQTAKRQTTTFVSYCSRFNDGCEVWTTNAPWTFPHQLNKDREVAQFPDIQDLNRLHRLHQSMVDRKEKSVGRCAVFGADPIDFYRTMLSKDVAREVEKGVYFLDSTEEVCRFTWKGACLCVWNSKWPIYLFRLSKQKRQAKKLLQSLKPIDTSF